MSDYLGSFNYIGSMFERFGTIPEPSMAQVRQLLTEYAVLPLGSQLVHERLEPHLKTLLLYGHHNTGKKLLAHAIANGTGEPQNFRMIKNWRDTWSHVILGRP
jgi:IQ and AAA domain-containing protein